jgi:hypothetical protein
MAVPTEPIWETGDIRNVDGPGTGVGVFVRVLVGVMVGVLVIVGVLAAV